MAAYRFTINNKDEFVVDANNFPDALLAFAKTCVEVSPQSRISASAATIERRDHPGSGTYAPPSRCRGRLPIHSALSSRSTHAAADVLLPNDSYRVN